MGNGADDSVACLGHVIIAAEDFAMSMQSPTELEAFYSFLGNTLQRGERETPLEAVVRKWRAEREMEQSCAAILAGMADIEAGRCRPIEEFDAEFRQRNGLPSRGNG
jgi:predicted transcriptional regulator